MQKYMIALVVSSVFAPILVAQNESLDEFETLHLASEVAAGDFCLVENRSIPECFHETDRKNVFLSCTCVDAAIVSKESNRQLEFKLKFGRKISSMSQSVTLKRSESLHKKIWNCTVLQDVIASQPIIRLAEGKSEFTCHVTMHARGSIKPDFESSRNWLTYSSKTFQTLNANGFQEQQLQNGVWQSKFKLKGIVAKDKPIDQLRSEISICVPSSEFREVSDKEKFRRKYKTQIVQVYFSNSKVKSAVLNFGATRVGSSKRRQLMLPGIEKEDFESLRTAAVMPDSIQLSLGSAGKIWAEFKPSVSGKIEEEVTIPLGEEVIGVVKLRGFGFEKLNR